MDHAPLAAAEAFHPPGAVLRVSPLGSGNVNDTFLVETRGGRYPLSVVLKPGYKRQSLGLSHLQQQSDSLRLGATTSPGPPMLLSCLNSSYELRQFR